MWPSLPVSQFYHVAVDNAVPYNVYGGLQDNGCWRGPSASWTDGGILNEDMGSLCAAATASTPFPILRMPRAVYATSQFLGLGRNDTRTWQNQDIRPGDPHGRHQRSAQLEHVGQEMPEQVLGNAMHPANWDAACIDLAARSGDDLCRRPASVPVAATGASPGKTLAT